MIKKILTITSIAVLAIFIMTISMQDDAQAQLVMDTSDFKCDKGFGSFFPAVAGTIFSSGWTDCSLLGQAGISGPFAVVALGPGIDCVTLTSTADSFAINEKGSIRITFPLLTQCFTDASGAPVSALAGFVCPPPPAGTQVFSTVTGGYIIPTGVAPDWGGNVDGKPVVGGVGTITSMVNHCDPLAPFGNSFTSTITGNIILLV